MTHTTHYRVYYEDTDAGGVVYYANYLKFAERARTDMLREKGLVQTALLEERNLAFVVRRAELDLKKPARLDDWLRVESALERVSGVCLYITQNIFRDIQELACVKVQVACVSAKDFTPMRLPQDVVAVWG
jgi:acyl-CoA thioester hydrolase